MAVRCLLYNEDGPGNGCGHYLTYTANTPNAARRNWICHFGGNRDGGRDIPLMEPGAYNNRHRRGNNWNHTFHLFERPDYPPDTCILQVLLPHVPQRAG